MGIGATDEGLVPGIGWTPASNSTTKTDLGKSLEPPKSPQAHRVNNPIWAGVVSYVVGSSLGIFLAATVYVGIFYVLYAHQPKTANVDIMIFLGALGGFFAGLWYFRKPPKDYLTQKAAYDAALHRWQNEWFCPQCGHRWQPADPRQDIREVDE